ncbi:tRNA dimethylallyltransferase miaA [Pontimonas salivibrio]|uniref:tRNA dimethylallyltransferase n=2 Tax=Pontimonas salivibrio TaxID=1159327 RepID=A0A2L2BRN9_9MICO|nr:tRNA dimethylallyltransferase miaA [Pontimonas salivibrio]
MMASPTMWALVGPTGTGKTATAIAVAKAATQRGLSVEIVSADAMQLYRGMDIGTAKASPTERAQVPHHLLDTWEPSAEASVEDYQRMAREAIVDAQARGVVPLLVGGSGLYVSSVIYDFRFPGHDPQIRDRLEAQLENKGLVSLVALLREKDPQVADAVDVHNPRRVVRALEIMELTGEPPSASLAARGSWWFQPCRVVGLAGPWEWLDARINQRVEQMWQRGLVDEVRTLREAGLGKTAAQAIGYREVIDHLDGETSEPEAKEQVSQHTRRYARKQMSWFRRDENIHWINASGDSVETEVADYFLQPASQRGRG